MCGGVFIVAGIVNCNNAISLAFGVRGFLFFIFLIVKILKSLSSQGIYAWCSWAVQFFPFEYGVKLLKCSRSLKKKKSLQSRSFISFQVWFFCYLLCFVEGIIVFIIYEFIIKLLNCH